MKCKECGRPLTLPPEDRAGFAPKNETCALVHSSPYFVYLRMLNKRGLLQGEQDKPEVCPLKEGKVDWESVVNGFGREPLEQGAGSGAGPSPEEGEEDGGELILV